MWPYYLVSKLPLWCILFFFFFWHCHLANLGPLQWKHRVLPTGPPGKSPLWWILKIISHFLWWKEEVFMWSSFTLSLYLVGRFRETARVTQLNSSQIPLSTIEQNPSQVLSSEELTESHWSLSEEKNSHHSRIHLNAQALTNQAPDHRPFPLSSFLIKLCYCILYTI